MSPGAEIRGAHYRIPDWVRSVGWGLARIAPVLGLIVAWELFARSGRVTMFVLPPFSAVAARIWEDALGGDLWINIAGTLYRTFAGFILGSIAGVLIAIGIARSRIAHWFFDPLISIGFPMPKVAFLPVIILWLGVFDVSKIAMVTIEVIFPVVTATVAGISGVSHELIWSARNMGAKDRELLTQIIMPAALPQIFTGLQVAMPIAMIVAVFTEMALGGYGLGAAMNSASKFADSRGVYAGIVEIAVVGYLVVVAMAMLRRRLLVWHQEAQAPSTV
ncbi:MAG: ABC transporter permease [Hyphomicrobiales bacterium]|nr:ABC transporter permease [Hyphomicrobiales bacterium]